MSTATLVLDSGSRQFLSRSGGIELDDGGNEVLAGLTYDESQWYLAHRPLQITVRPAEPRSARESHWWELHRRYRDARLRFYPGPRRRLSPRIEPTVFSAKPPVVVALPVSAPLQPAQPIEAFDFTSEFETDDRPGESFELPPMDPAANDDTVLEADISAELAKALQ